MGRLVVGSAQEHFRLLETASDLGESPFQILRRNIVSRAQLSPHDLEDGVGDPALETGDLVSQFEERFH